MVKVSEGSFRVKNVLQKYWRTGKCKRLNKKKRNPVKTRVLPKNESRLESSKIPSNS